VRYLNKDLGKKGQFFIVAAILITVVMFSMIGVSTYTIIREDPRTVSEISEELNRESLQLIDFGIFNEENITDLMDNFTSRDIAGYFLEKTDDANIIFVYGDGDDLKAVQFDTKNTGEIALAGTVTQMNSGVATSLPISTAPGDEYTEVDIKINGNSKKYFFELKENKVFYFVVIQKKGEEIFVNSNQRGPTEGDRPGGGLPFGLGGVSSEGEKFTVCWKGEDKKIWKKNLQHWLDRGATRGPCEN